MTTTFLGVGAGHQLALIAIFNEGQEVVEERGPPRQGLKYLIR
jgi:hypothetical protein